MADAPPNSPEVAWVEVDPAEAEVADDFPTCDVGFAGHEWELTIEYGDVSITSGCVTCDDVVDREYLCAVVKGKVVVGQDHPDLGGWHGLTRCDCNWWFEFQTEQSGERARP